MIDKHAEFGKRVFAECKKINADPAQRYQFIVKFERNNLLCNVKEGKRSGTTFYAV